MKKLSQTTRFGKDVKRIQKRGEDIAKLKSVVAALANGESLDGKHRDHALVGSWKNARDCHVEADWVLIYSTDKHSLRLERTGTHSELFKK